MEKFSSNVNAIKNRNSRMKNIVSALSNSLDGLVSRLDTARKIIVSFEDRLTESIHKEAKREK